VRAIVNLTRMLANDWARFGTNVQRDRGGLKDHKGVALPFASNVCA